MFLHHIAIKVTHVASTADFYHRLFGIEKITENFHDDGSLKSVWLQLGDLILMLEEAAGTRRRVLIKNHVMAFKIQKGERDLWRKKLKEQAVKIERESPYSLYFKDPEGNDLAVSHYPEAFA